MVSPIMLPVVALIVGCSLSVVLTPMARYFAIKFGLVDYPDRRRKLHRQPVARCGGPVLIGTLFLSVLAAIVIFPEQAIHLVEKSSQAASLALGAVAIAGLGMIDDRYGLLGRQKLAIQIAICLGMIAFGFDLKTIQIFRYTVDLGLLSWPISLIWLLLCINAINLIDGADGLCSTIGAIALFAVAAISSYTGNHMEAIIAASLGGALVGFLAFNLPPAKVFLGDSGSMVIGLFLGVLTMRAWFSHDASISITIPIVLMAIPLFDAAMAVVRRKLTGRSVFATDRGHIHHHLMRHGYHDRALVGIIALLSSITAAGAVAGVILQSDIISLGTMFFAIGSLVVSKLFGFAELKLLSQRGSRLLSSLFLAPNTASRVAHQDVIQLQGNRNWNIVWYTLVEFAEKHELAQVRMDLNVPWLHEGYHAEWKLAKLPDLADCWSLRFPLVTSDGPVGRFEFIGKQQESETLSTIAQLTELLDAMQNDLEAFLKDFRENRGVEEYRDEINPVPSVISAAD